MSLVWDRMQRLLSGLLEFRHLTVVSSILFFLIIGVVLFLDYQNARLMRAQINDDFNRQQLILARQAASQIDASIEDIEVEMTSIRKCLEVNPDGFCWQWMVAALERNRRKGLIEIGVAGTDGAILKTSNSGSKPAPDTHRILTDCEGSLPEHMVLGPLHVEPGDAGPLHITGILCSKIRFRDGSAGLLFGRIEVGGLIGAVARETRSGQTGYAWAIDENGVFLFHPEEAFIGRNAFTVRKERKPHISFVKINQIMRERMLKGQEGTGVYVSGWHRGIEQRIEKLIAFTPVKSEVLSSGHSWSLAVAAPVSEVAEAVHSLQMRHFATVAALIVATLVFGLLAMLYQQRISNTLKERVRQTEANLHERERIYQRVVEQATDLIYILDLDMRIALLNRHSVETFLGLVVRQPDGGVIPVDLDMTQPGNWIGRRLVDFFPARDAAFMRRQIEHLLDRQSNISYEHTLSSKGRKVHLSTKLIPIRDDSGGIQQVLGISRDVTERMEMDQRIYNTEKLASIGTLAAGVAHEINNPLAIILGFTDLLIERFKEGSPEHEDLKIIEYTGRHAKKIVENLLAFARITEGLEDKVDIKRSVETVMNIVRNTLLTKKIELEMDMPQDLPRVRGDDREFQQVIFNLVNNSVAAMEPSGGRLTLKAEKQDGWVHVTVIDTGSGIADRIKPQIFDPFFTTKKAGEGTGLGLSLCYGIVKKYGGKITFSSVSREDSPDKPSGTAFRVSLPVHRAGSETAEGGHP